MQNLPGVLLLFLSIAIIFVVPWLAFWCIGVLFDHHIAFTLTNWFAGLLLLVLIGGSSRGGG